MSSLTTKFRNVSAPSVGLGEQLAHLERRCPILTAVLLCLALSVCVVVVYWQVREFEFINYDDTEYVVSNAMVQKGLSHESVLWAFRTGHAANWHPVTWISHMVDVTVFGLDPGAHHLMNASLHLINTLLLFVLLRVMTGTAGPSAFVAALFAVHPVHVEPVAWVSERKDLLSAFFWILTTGAYAWYVNRRTLSRYLLVCLVFALGLMAKPMLVTLPLVLLLLDLWPLKRVNMRDLLRGNLGLAAEKLPLLLMSMGSCVVTFLVQRAGGAVSSLEAVSLLARLQNAAISYVRYLADLLGPKGLAVLYPLEAGQIQVWQALSSLLLLVAATVGALRLARQIPYLTVGWLWFVGTLVPVIGIVQVGLQAHADRYTYIPSIGIFIMIAYGLPHLLPGWRWKEVLLGGAAVLIVIVAMVSARQQAGYWKNSRTLFTRALVVTTDNYLAHNNLGTALLRENNVDEAMVHFEESLRIRPRYGKALLNRGIGMGMRGQYADAQRVFESLIEIDPANDRAYGNLGKALLDQGDLEGAIQHFQKAVELNPMNANAHRNLQDALAKRLNSRERK